MDTAAQPTQTTPVAQPVQPPTAAVAAAGALAGSTPTADARPTDDGGKSGLFTYTRWLHIGTGAEACSGIKRAEGEQRVTGVACNDPDHVHVWIRLPNPFQQNEIREKALAARARRIRVLRDEGTDSRAIMEEELDQLRRAQTADGGEAVRTLSEELVNEDWFKDQLEALQNVQDRDEFEHIERDRERRKELEDEFAAGPADAEPSEELAHLRVHFAAYAKAIEEELHKLQQPKYAALADKDPEDLIAMVREKRIKEDAESEFMHTYSFWSWFYGTYTSAVTPDGKHPTRRYATIEALKEEEELVIDALQENFKALESVKNRREQGNS